MACVQVQLEPAVYSGLFPKTSESQLICIFASSSRKCVLGSESAGINSGPSVLLLADFYAQLFSLGLYLYLGSQDWAR